MDKLKKAAVRRITVDERLSDDHIRLLIASLAEGVETFADRDEDWRPEREVLVRPATYARWMSVRKEKLPWRTLEEGQVFLAGQFEVLGDPAAPDGFQVCPGVRAFLRIDRLPLVKEQAKLLYSALVRGEEARDG